MIDLCFLVVKSLIKNLQFKMEQPKEASTPQSQSKDVILPGDQIKSLSMRFYKDEFPKEGDLVMVQIKDVTEYATIVELLEYNNKEGTV